MNLGAAIVVTVAGAITSGLGALAVIIGIRLMWLAITTPHM